MHKPEILLNDEPSVRPYCNNSYLPADPARFVLVASSLMNQLHSTEPARSFRAV